MFWLLVFIHFTVSTRRQLWKEATSSVLVTAACPAKIPWAISESLWFRSPQEALLVANTAFCLSWVHLITKCSAIIICNWVFCFSKPWGRGARWVKDGRSVERWQAVGSLSPHPDSYRIELNESLIGLGKHPHGVYLWTKRAILSSLVMANALRPDKSWLASRCPLTTNSKNWCDSRGTWGLVNLNLNV